MAQTTIFSSFLPGFATVTCEAFFLYKPAGAAYAAPAPLSLESRSRRARNVSGHAHIVFARAQSSYYQQSVDPCQSDNNVHEPDQPANPEYCCYQVEPEQSYQAPVDGARYEEYQSGQAKSSHFDGLL